ncbi:MAG: hypothetical protein ACI399_00660 [Candidatus Cryptobacteroides sp.]
MADNNATYDEVKAFLDEFKAKARVFGILYNEDKGENRQTLFDLELYGSKRDQYILNLRPEDYKDRVKMTTLKKKKVRYGCSE